MSLLPLSVLKNVCKSENKLIVDLTLKKWMSTLHVNNQCSCMKLIHATWLVEMYNFLSLYLSQGLVTKLCQVKRCCLGNRVSLKMRNQSDLKHEIFKKSQNLSVAKYSNLKIAKLTCRKNFM